MNKSNLFFCVINFSNYIFLSTSLPGSLPGFLQQYVQAKIVLCNLHRNKNSFSEPLFNAIVLKVHPVIDALSDDRFLVHAPVNKKGTKAKNNKHQAAEQVIICWYTIATDILNGIKITLQQKQTDHFQDESLKFVYYMMQNEGTFEQVHDCMIQAIQNQEQSEITQLMDHVCNCCRWNMLLRCDTLRLDDFFKPVLLNFRRNAQVLAVTLGQKIELRQQALSKKIYDLQVEEEKDRSNTEIQALNASAIQSYIEKKICEQNFKAQLKQERVQCMQEQSPGRTNIDSEQIQNRLELLQHNAENKKLVVQHEEQSMRDLFFKRFTNQAFLAVVQLANRRHTNMIVRKRFERCLYPFMIQEAQQRLMLECDQERQNLQQQGDVCLAMIEKKSCVDFNGVMKTLPAYQKLQQDMVLLLENWWREQQCVDQQAEYGLLSERVQKLRAVIPRVNIKRRNNPYSGVVLLPDDNTEVDMPNFAQQTPMIATRAYDPYRASVHALPVCLRCGKIVRQRSY